MPTKPYTGSYTGSGSSNTSKRSRPRRGGEVARTRPRLFDRSWMSRLMVVSLLALLIFGIMGFIVSCIVLSGLAGLPELCLAQAFLFFACCLSLIYLTLHLVAATRNLPVDRQRALQHPLQSWATVVARIALVFWILSVISVPASFVKVDKKNVDLRPGHVDIVVCVFGLISMTVVTFVIEYSEAPFKLPRITPEHITCRLSALALDEEAFVSVSRQCSAEMVSEKLRAIKEIDYSHHPTTQERIQKAAFERQTKLAKPASTGEQTSSSRVVSSPLGPRPMPGTIPEDREPLPSRLGTTDQPLRKPVPQVILPQEPKPAHVGAQAEGWKTQWRELKSEAGITSEGSTPTITPATSVSTRPYSHTRRAPSRDALRRQQNERISLRVPPPMPRSQPVRDSRYADQQGRPLYPPLPPSRPPGGCVDRTSIPVRAQHGAMMPDVRRTPPAPTMTARMDNRPRMMPTGAVSPGRYGREVFEQAARRLRGEDFATGRERLDHDRGLLLALIGITSLLTDLGSGTRDFGARCIDEAETTVLGELEKPSTLKLQTLVLIIKHRILMRRFPSAFMLHAVASRFAVALRLNHENPRLCFLAQESRRRLMWAVYMIDTGIAAGHPDFGLWENKAPSNIRIQLPCNERNFDFDLPEVTEPLEQPAPGPDGAIPPMTDDIGFLALHIRVCLLRSRILQYTKNMIHGSPTPEQIANLPARFAELESQLGAFAARLPVSFSWSEANCHIDLYRVAAHSGVSRDALPQTIMARIEASHPGFAGICRRQIFEHARAMADMFSLMLTLDGVPVTDMDLPVCLYQCARMLYLSLHTSGVEFGITTESVQEMGNVCLRVLKQTITAPAAMGIRADLERLLATGIPSDLAPSIPESPEIPIGGQARNPVPGLLAQNLLSNTNTNQIGMNAAQYQSPIAAALPNGAQSSFPQNTVAATPFQAATTQPPTPMAQVDQPTATATAPTTADEAPKSPSAASLHPSNAFDGPFDGLDFNMDQFGMDSQSWYSTEWLGGDFSSAAGNGQPAT
ncbi:hypothetical protein PspLS_08728 [Pyricularia sp. CBS 133598]|nr:hypothetical protein PspLS_08728 [Pyricularia sp. CBS 133598]